MMVTISYGEIAFLLFGVFAILYLYKQLFTEKPLSEFEIKYQKYQRDKALQDAYRDRFLKELEMREFYLGKDAYR